MTTITNHRRPLKMTTSETPRGAATREELVTLHDLLVRTLVQHIKTQPSAALLSVAEKLLRANGVTADSLRKHDPTERAAALAAAMEDLPSFEDEDA
jgi:hypothetical protein